MIKTRKNLIVFYTDAQRYDSLGCYGNPVVKTPHIDSLATNGVRFDNHYAAGYVCMPSRASFFTGRYPQAHRVLDNGISLPKSESTLADVLAGTGYETHAVGKLHFTSWNPSDGRDRPESIISWQEGKMDGWNGPYYGFERVEIDRSSSL